MNDRKALVMGASGLVGSKLLEILLESERYEKVIALVRKPLLYKHAKLQEVVIDFDNLEEEYPDIAVDDVYCAIGTTIKKAKTKERMYQIDVEYPLTVARLAKKKGMQHFVVISAMGANLKSRFFYTRIKGDLEEKLTALDIPKLSIFRPSLLVDERDEFRFGEKMAIALYKGIAWFLPNALKTKFGIEASTVAKAMYNTQFSKSSKVIIYQPVQIEELAKYVNKNT
ncbi:MAG: NAD(P)H-binding protein [Bacillus sp. (in: firmicutes)]